MKIQTLTPKQAVNKAFLKERINRIDIEGFKSNMTLLFDRIQATDKESEENRKNIVAKFLESFYAPQYEINTKGRKDLVIHGGKTAKEPVAVIFETKKPDSSEMMSDAKPNSKAMQQLVLYYLDERIEHKNTAVKHLIATDIFNWYIFDENLFDKHIYRNPKFIKGYETYKQGNKDTEFFYKQIAQPILEDLDVTFECTHFNLKNYEKTVRNAADTEGDKPLIALFKIFSPVHLLKLPFANDSNQLDRSFYTELLHIIGLEEVKEGSKKLIKRKVKPDEYSLLENTMTKIENKGVAFVTELQKFGATKAEQAENIALELCITWVNRILFLKLLEAQLITYHRGNPAYRFLNANVIYDYDRLNKLFFEVLAEKTENRKGKVKTEFERVPYLNSSLFERTDLERKTLEINYLDDREEIPVLSTTVLKDPKGKRQTGGLPTLDYLFAFLDSYDFASEGTEGIQDDKRTLINASVLGLIFEKINGYKDGSFFTPSFITMYMCRETIRRAVVQKFRETNLPHFKDLTHFDDLKDAITDRKQANDVINSLKICDPAVGSGHFLVSALNEIISVKSDLDVLSYRDGSRVKFYKIEIQNDELIVTDEDNGDIFQYFVNEKGVPPQSVQKLQETLFHEKQTIIENCLFGVDINPNSVKICRLRLWIELLKNAYFTEGSQFLQLETLPNIDINIKQGNSLISRFKLNDDLSDVFKKQGFSYKNYRKAVEDYKNTNSKDAKADLVVFIENIKEQFKTAFHTNAKEYKDLSKHKGQLLVLRTQGDLFGGGIDAVEEDRLAKLVAQYEQKVSDIKNNVLFTDAFEWRFEFPEVLDTEGGYVGFDVVIGNPPYLTGKSLKNEKETYNSLYKTAQYQLDLYVLFIERTEQILKPNAHVSLITPNSWLKNMMMTDCREFVMEHLKIISINPNISRAFEEASVDTMIYLANKTTEKDCIDIWNFNGDEIEVKNKIEQNRFKENDKLVFDVEVDSDISKILKKMRSESKKVEHFFEIVRGINPYDALRGQSQETIKSRAYHADYKKDDSFVPIIKGKHVQKYTFSWDNKHYISYGNWLAAPREEKFFKGERIIFREILGKTFVSTIISEEMKIDRSLYIALPKLNINISVKYALGLLASKLLAWSFRYEKNEFDDVFPKIRLEEFKNLPIKDIPETEQLPIINLVEEILRVKQSTPSVSTAEMEEEVDKLVYGLYGLSEAEIGIIEGSMK